MILLKNYTQRPRCPECPGVGDKVRNVKGVGDKVPEKVKVKDVQGSEQIHNPRQLAPRSATKKSPQGTDGSDRAVALGRPEEPAGGVLEEPTPPRGSCSGSGSGRNSAHPPNFFQFQDGDEPATCQFQPLHCYQPRFCAVVAGAFGRPHFFGAFF